MSPLRLWTLLGRVPEFVFRLRFPLNLRFSPLPPSQILELFVERAHGIPHISSVRAGKTLDSLKTLFRTRIQGHALAMVAACIACNGGPRFQGKNAKAWSYDLDSKYEFERLHACEALAVLGSDEPALISPYIENIAPLIASSRDSKLRAAAAQTLLIAGAEGHDLIGGFLDHPKDEVRFEAIRALAEVDAWRGSALDALDSMLANEDSPRFEAAQRFASQQGADAVSHLLKGLSEDSNRVRARTLQSLGDLGAQAVEAAPLVKSMFEVQESTIRTRALKTFVRIAPYRESAQVLSGFVRKGKADQEMATLSAVLLRDLPPSESQ